MTRVRATIDDRAIDGIRIDDASIDDMPFTESDLCARFSVDFIRSPRNETLIIEDGHYEGIFKIENLRFPGTYDAFLWTVIIHRVDSTDYTIPKKGLVQIKRNRYDSKRFGHPIDAFKGKCSIIADKDGRIVSIEQINEHGAEILNYQI